MMKWRLLLALVSLTTLSTAFGQQFHVPLKVTDGVDSSVVYLGFFPGANNCIVTTDTLNGHGETFLPPPPPGGVFDARFISPRNLNTAVCYDQGSDVDFRPPNSWASLKDTFKVKCQFGIGSTMVLSWPAGLSSYFKHLTLRYNDGSGNVNLDMLANTSIDVSLAGDPATVTIFSDTLKAPEPGFGVTPASLLYGALPVGNLKIDSIGVQNTGFGPLTIGSITSTNGAFALIAPPAFPVVVSPLATRYFRIGFTAPNVLGPQTGTLTINHNATGSPGTVALSATVTTAFAPDSASLDFGYVHFLETRDLPVTVTNRSTSLPITISGIAAPAQFTVSPLPSPALVIPPSGTQVFHVVYAPSVLGPSTGAIHFTYDLAGGQSDVAVAGTGLAATSVSGGPVHFGSVYQNSTATNATVIVANTSSGTLHVTVASTFPDFTVSPGPSFDIAGVGTQILTITYAPVTVGPVSGNITITHNGGGITPPIAVDGTGLALVTGNPDPLPFGNVVVPIPPATCPPAPVTSTATVTNHGSTPIVFTSITPMDVAYSVAETTATIAPGGTESFHITFLPLTEGNHNSSIAFTYSGFSSPYQLQVTGTGLSCFSPKYVTVTPDSMSIMTNGTYQAPVARDPVHPQMPNWANLMQEVVVQGGFRPGSSESDAAGGMTIGVAYMHEPTPNVWVANQIRKDTAWVRLTRWKFDTHPYGSRYAALQSTLAQRGGNTPLIIRHDAYARGLDSTLNPGDARRYALRGQLSSLLPTTTKNKLFAELIALKFNIASSTLRKSPAGFGELHYTVPNNPCNGLTVRQVAARIDSAMTFWRFHTAAYFDSLYSAAFMINRACVGKLDTTVDAFGNRGSFYRGNTLRVVGVAGPPPYLTGPTDAPITMDPTTDMTEAPEDALPEESSPEGIPSTIRLYQNYPNPFNPSTAISFTLAQPSSVTLTIYSVLGQEIATLLRDEVLPDGIQELTFDASSLSSGVYFYTITGRDLQSGAALPRSIRKMMLLK